MTQDLRGKPRRDQAPSKAVGSSLESPYPKGFLALNAALLASGALFTFELASLERNLRGIAESIYVFLRERSFFSLMLLEMWSRRKTIGVPKGSHRKTIQ